MATAVYLSFLLAIADFVGVYVLIDAPFATAATALHYFLVSLGSLATLLGIAFPLLGAAGTLCRRCFPRWLSPTLAGAALGAATFLLNLRFVPTHAVFLALLVSAAVGGGALLAWLSGGPELSRRTGNLFAASCLALAGLLYLIDAGQLRGLYFLQHLTMGLYTWVLLWAGGNYLVGRWLPWFTSQRALRLAILGDGLICAMAVVVLWATPGEAVSQNLRYVLFSGSTATREALHVLSVATDFDRDGYASLLGQGDCAPLDGDIHPGAADLPGDGLDRNCLGGDVSPDELSRFVAARGPRATDNTPQVKNVVMISVDALRYDRVVGKEAHPVFAALAERGISFERAYCLYPGTVPALYGLATSSYPGSIRLTPHDHLELPIHDEQTTLFEVLGRAGIASHGILYYAYMAPRFGMSRGMTQVRVGRDMKQGISSAETTRMGLEFLEQANSPFFLWLHYFDPHAPYNVEAGHEKKGAPDEERYGVEVDRAARAVDVFMQELERSGRTADTAVIFTADHGEEFGDHGLSYHGQTLYDETTRVPLVFLLPGGLPRQQAAPISHIDLAPTILDLLGQDHAIPDSWRGRSLGPLLAGTAATTAPQSSHSHAVFLEVFQARGTYRAYGVVQWPWKLIYTVQDNLFELYNLEEDPDERKNIFDPRPDIGASLVRLLDLHLAAEL